MLSENKFLLRLSEGTAAIAALASLLFSLRCYLGKGSESIEFEFIAGFALLMITVGPACALGGEYVRTVRHPKSYRERMAGLSGGDVMSLVRWAPPTHKLAGVFGMLMGLVAGVIFGPVGWSSEHPPILKDGIAGGLFLSTFFLLALPVLASAARMPGSYAESCGDDA